MSYFDYPQKFSNQLCVQCDMWTEHSRWRDSALWTCRGPGHKHPRPPDRDRISALREKV
jgi:hypothetical protein